MQQHAQRVPETCDHREHWRKNAYCDAHEAVCGRVSGLNKNDQRRRLREHHRNADERPRWKRQQRAAHKAIALLNSK